MENNRRNRKQDNKAKAHGKDTCKSRPKLFKTALMLCLAVMVSACCLFSLPMIEAFAAAPGSGTVEESHTTEGVEWVKNGNTWTCTIDVEDDSLSWYAYESSVPDGYMTISTSSDARSVSGNAVTIENSGAKHTLTLDPNGGSVENSPVSINKDFYTFKTTLNNAPIPTRANCTFAGWYDSGKKVFNADGTANAEETEYWRISGENTVWNKNANFTVTARWIPHYNITYDIGDGSWPSGAVHPESTKQGVVFEVTKPTPPSEGYKFVYWQLTGMDGNTHYWDAADGTTAQGTATNANAVVDSSAAKTEPATKFKNLQSTPGATVTFKAVYGEKTGIIKYNANGHGTAPESEEISYTQPYNVADAPNAPTGYTFQRWNTKADDSGSAFAPGARYKNENQVVNVLGDPIGFNDNDILYAIWKTHKYNITYDLAGGTAGSSKPTSAYWDEVKTIDNPTRTGYTFEGWSISGMDGNTHYWDTADGTTARGGNATATEVKATKFKNLNATDGSTVKLTATWAPVPYQITVKSVLRTTSGSAESTVGGTATGTAMVNYDAKANLTATVSNANAYTFKGWAKTATATSYLSTSTTYQPVCKGEETYYAIFEENVGKITYNANGHGTAPGSVDNRYANAVSAASIDNITGTTMSDTTGVAYRFKGWATTQAKANAGTVEYASGASIKAANTKPVTMTLYAVWEEATAALTYNNAGHGANPTNVTMKYTDVVSAAAALSENGYTFGGWDGSNNKHYDAGASIKAANIVPEALTLTAKWTLINYTITYNLNDSTGSTDAVHTNPKNNYNIETNTFTLVNPTRTGYDFAGWTGSNGDTPQKTVTIEKGTTGNKSYKANWTPKEYTITAKAVTIPYGGSRTESTDGGTVTGTGSYDFDSTAELTATAKEGYTFAGWTDSETATTSTNKTNPYKPAVTGAKTYYALFTEKTATLTYNNGGHGTAPASVTMKYTGATNAADELTAHGYTFTGWKRSDNNKVIEAGSQVKKANEVPSNLTLTAQWSLDDYSITYNLNDETGSTEAVHNDPKRSYSIEDETFTLVNPTRTGYTFAGWTGSNGDTPQMTVTIAKGTYGNKSYKANWTPNPYEITVSAATRTPDGTTISTDGGTVSGGGTYDFDTKANLTATVKTGYTFKGWATDKDATNYKSTETNYKPAVTGATTYIAIFEEKTAKLTYDENGHGTKPADVTMRYTRETKAAAALTETGYTFIGWAASQEHAEQGTKDYDGGQTVKATNTIPTATKLIALWDVNNYKITYAGLDGATIENKPANADYNQDITIDNPEKVGYIFEGWKIEGMDTSTHKIGSSTSNAETISKTKETEFKNLTSVNNATVKFTALWTPITYNVDYELSGGTAGGTYPATASYDGTFTVATPTRLGYTFEGWTIEGMDTVTHYYGTSTSNAKKLTGIKATTFKNLTSVKDATVKFTAVWKVNTYSLHYELEGGEYGSKHPTTATYNEAFVVSNPTREGYYFNGWTITGMDTASTHCWDNGSGSTEHGSNATATGVKQTKFKNLRAENGTVTFTATWVEMTADITLDNNGHGPAMDPIHIRYSQAAKTPEDIIITGLRVKEWNTDKDGDGIAYDPDTVFKTANSLTLAGHDNVTVIPDGITLYAIWDEAKGNLRYHANGHGGDDPSSFLMRYTRTASVGDALSETGWIFKGWNTQENGSGTMYQPGQKFKDAESLENVEGVTVLPDGADLYAVWEEMKGTLTYDENGHGTAPEAATVWYTKEHKMPATQNVVGYTFKEWNTKSNGKGYGYAIGSVYKKPNELKSEDGTTVIPSGAKVYAIWTELKGTLTFDANGHGTAPEAMEMRYSQATTTPTMSNVEGWVFLGWATSKAHASEETVDYPARTTFKEANNLKSTGGETVIPSGTTLYAVWVADEGTLTYDAQGHGKAPESVHIRYSKDAKVASDTMKETGWTFKEWNTKADGTGYSFVPGAAYKEEDTFFNIKGEKVIPSGDTLYAIWVENTATLTYDLNYEGAPANTTSTMRYTQAEKVKTQVPTRGAGYTFKEWNTGKYGAATSYAPGSTFKNANVDPKDATLYAIWVEETATLTYHANGHGTEPEAETQYYSKQTKVNGSISCPGWVFLGWNTKADGTGTLYQKGSVLKNPNQTPHNIDLYAIWEQERHTMTVEANGGKFSGNKDSVSFSMTVNSDEHTSFGDMPVLEGKVCTGLYTRKIGGAKIYNENGKITNDGVFFKDGVFIYNSDFTLYAQWSDEPVKCVVYDKNTEDPVSNMPIEETKFLDKPITLSNKIPSRDGYTFIYWSTDPAGAKGDTYYVQNGAGSVFPVDSDKAYGNYEDGPVVLYAQWQKNGEADDAKAKLDVRYNIYASDVENGLLDAEIVYNYRNMFMQNKEVKQRRTIFVDSDQELTPSVIVSSPTWAEGDPIPGIPNKPKPEEPTQPTEPTEPTVEPDPEYTEVKTEEELNAAIKNFDYTKGDKLYLSLANDIELTSSVTIPIDANVDIDLEGKTLSIAASTMKPNGSDCTSALTVLGDLTIGNGTVSAADACVSICDMGNFTALEDIVFTDDATYAVFFEKGAGSATAVLLGTTVGKTDVLCGTQNQFSTLTAKDDAKIASETLYADFTSKNTDGLVIENAYTAADPTNHVNDIEYTVIENTFEDYNYRVTGSGEAVNCTVIAEVEGEGVISGTGDYRQNTVITLEAIPDPGSRFVRWVNASGDTVSTRATWEFKLVADLELTAVFEHIPHDIDVESCDTSMGTVSGSATYGETEQATIKAVPKKGYVFSGWKKIVNGSPEDEFSSTDAEYTFTVTEDALYRAYFDAVHFTLHVDRPAYVDEEVYTIKVKINGDEDDLNLSGDYNLDSNDSVVVSAVVNDLSGEDGRDYTKAYTINGWVDSTSIEEGDVTQISSNSEYAFTIDGDVNLMLVLNLTDAEVNNVINSFKETQKNYVEAEFTTYVEDYLEKAQPIGSIYTSTDESLGKGDHYDDSSSEYYHVDLGLLRVQDQLGGKWERVENTFLKSADSGEDVGDTGGRVKYRLSLAMTAGSGKFGYVPGSISSYLQTPSLIEDRTYSKFSKGTGAPSGNVIVTDEEQLGEELEFMPPYQSVYVFRRIDEFKGLHNITDNESEAYNHCYWFSRPGEDVLKSGYTAERLQNPESLSEDQEMSEADQTAYEKGYRYKVVEKPTESEEGEGE